MRICLVSQEYPPGYVGGIGTQTRVKARGLLAQGHEVEVLTAGEETGPALATRQDDGVTVHALRPPGGAFPMHTTEAYWLGYTWSVLAALRSLGERPDDPLLRIGTFMEDTSVETADGLLAASHSIAELTSARLEIDPDLIDVVAGAVESDLFTPAPADRARAPKLLFVGNLVPNKGVATVLEAFIRLAGEHPELTLELAGSAEADVADELRARAERAGLGDRVRVLGFVEHEDLPGLYRSADVFAAPSRYEGGLGLVYLEAMACGLPVIATAAGGAAEAIENGETGLLLERGDVEETTAAIGALLHDPARRARMGAAGRERVCAHYTPQRYTAKVIRAYERAIERRRGSPLVQTA